MNSKHPSFSIPTPTTNGDWQMIDGQLVDVSKSKAPAADAATDEAPEATGEGSKPSRKAR